MSNEANPFFAPEEIAKFKKLLKNPTDTFVFVGEDEDRTDEFCMFSFLGKYEGEEVVLNASLYTLKVYYHSEIYEIAENKIIAKFPQHAKWITDNAGEDEVMPESVEEEINTYLTEVIMDIEEEGSCKVEEHVFLEEEENALVVDAGLNHEKITEDVIKEFIHDYNAGTLELDATAYSFETDFDEE